MSKSPSATATLSSSSGCRALRSERGLASLIVVSLLFFIISLVAAYTNRNLIFEQRTSGNQYRNVEQRPVDAGLQRNG